ncbi:MAG: peptidoglycan-binding domain-containing protein, partial [Paracoccaceae bacterium]
APAIIETVTEQEVVTPEQRDGAGQIVVPATFRSTTKQRMVQDRQEVWFRTPCADELTVDVVATLQRALKARGLYDQPLTGVIDAETAEAIRRFQAERGLDSPQLSLAAARELGVISTALDAL